ncbi:hypothetical protein FFI87_017165 [Burkholderia sp. KBS0801]|nr:hypothetical protein FFI87_017165 [Burkholderia sp. KBS0801]
MRCKQRKSRASRYIIGIAAPGGRVAPCRAPTSTPRRAGELPGNRLYTLLPGRTGRASAHYLYSRRVRHPSRNS